MTQKGADERVEKESDKLFADTYFLFLAFVIAIAVIKFAHDRTFAIFLPAIIGGGGSLLYVLVRYAMAGVLFQHVSDERIAALKSQTKKRSYLFCWLIYVLSGVILLFLDFETYVPAGVLVSWMIPTLVVVIRLVVKGIYGSGEEKNTKKDMYILARYTPIGALFFGVVTTWFAETDGIWDFALQAFIMAATWGVVWFLAMVALNKLSDKFANKRLARAEKESEGGVE